MDDPAYFGFLRKDGNLKRRAATSFLIYNKQEYQRLKDDGSTLTNEDKVEIGRRWNNLPKEEKRKFEDQAASANELLSTLKALDSRPRKRRRKIQTRIALKQITEIVSKFSEEQRTAVKAIGLGGVLDLSCTKLNHGICEWLVNNFDPDTHSLTVHGRKFVITESHVEECLGINGQGNIVSMNSVEGFREMCTDLGVSKGFVEIKGLVVYLLKTTVADEGFKRKFALYILGSFLCPTTKPAVHESLINLVSDVGVMENVNWARITLEFLCNAIRGQRTHSRVHANGCLFLLLVFYLERVSPTGFLQIPRTDRPLLFWGDREIKNVLRRFKKIGGYMKQGVGVIFTREEVSMEDGEDKTNGKASNSHQIPNVVFHDMKSTLDKVVDLLERQTTVFERYFGSQVANNQYRMTNNHDEVGNKKQASNNKHFVQLNRNSRSPYTGERMSTPRTFRTHDGVVDHMKGQGDGTKDNKYGPIFPRNEYDDFQTTPQGTPQGKTHTPKRNYEDGVDDVPFSPSPSPLSGFKPMLGLSRGRKRKITKPTLRRSLRLSNYEPPDLRPRAELKKGPLVTSPYTRDGRKNRKPDNMSGRAQSPIVVDDVKFDVNSPSPYIGGLMNHCKSTKFHASYHVAELNPETKPYLRETLYYTTITRPKPLTPEEERLKNFIYDPSKELTYDAYVHIQLLGRDRFFATRGELWCLKPKQWISDTIIDLVAIQLTNAQRLKHSDRCHTTWYLPVLLVRKMLQYPKPNHTELRNLCRMYFGEHQLTAKLESCTSIYIPLNSGGHWICIKVDMGKQMTYLFDSMPCSPSNCRRLNLASVVMGVFDQMMRVQFGDLYQQDFSKFKVVSWERQPLQHHTDTYDCGLFVIKFMQGVDYPPGVHLMDDNERPRLLMDLVHDVNNRAKSFVLTQFDEWKGT